MTSLAFKSFFAGALFAIAACATEAASTPSITEPATSPSPAEPGGDTNPISDGSPKADASSSPDTGAPKPDAASAPDAAACGYEATEQFIVDCASAGGASAPKKVTVLESKKCPNAFALGGSQYASLAEALGAQTCNASCVRKAFQAVMLLRCGKKTEFISYHAESCSDVIDTPDGIFRSTEEWNAAKPCP